MAAADTPEVADDDRPEWMPPGGFTNPFLPGTWLHDEFGEVVRQDRDILILVDDEDARRGTGKTIMSLQLAAGMDQTAEGLTRDKVFIQPEQLLNAYREQPEGSALVLDEAEVGVSAYDTQSSTNRAIQKIVNTGRVEQKYVVMNLPYLEGIDLNLRRMATCWIMMKRRGLGLVHHLKREPYSATLLKPKRQWLEVEDIPADHPLRDVYNYLTREKRKHIQGERGEDFIPKSEHEKALRKTRQEVEQTVRDEVMLNVYETFRDTDNHVTQEALGRAVGLSQGGVRDALQRARDGGA